MLETSYVKAFGRIVSAHPKQQFNLYHRHTRVISGIAYSVIAYHIG